MAVEYLNIYFMGLPFLFMYNVLSSMFNALGRSRIPLYLLIFSSVFNIVLDIYLVRSLGRIIPMDTVDCWKMDGRATRHMVKSSSAL